MDQPEAMGLLHTAGGRCGLPCGLGSELFAGGLLINITITDQQNVRSTRILRARLLASGMPDRMKRGPQLIMLEPITSRIRHRNIREQQQHDREPSPCLRWIYGRSAWYVPYILSFSSSFFKGVFGASEFELL
jgi:hypothetical protein